MTTLHDLFAEVYGRNDAPPAPTRPPRRPRWNTSPQAWEGLGDQPRAFELPPEEGQTPFAGYHRPRIDQNEAPPRGMEMQRSRPTLADMRRIDQYGPVGASGVEAAQGLADFTGLGQTRRAAQGFTRGIMSGSPDMDAGWGQGWSNAGEAALNLGGTAGVVGDIVALERAGQQFRLPRTEAEPVTRLPVNPTRDRGPGGLPIAPSRPFSNSLRGSSEDLSEAAGMVRRDLDAGGPRPGSSPLEGEILPPGREVMTPPREPARWEDLTPEQQRQTLSAGLTDMGGRIDDQIAGIDRVLSATRIDPNPRFGGYRIVDARTGEALRIFEPGDSFTKVHAAWEEMENLRLAQRSASPALESPPRTVGGESTASEANARQVFDVPQAGRALQIIRNPAEGDLRRVIAAAQREHGQPVIRYVRDDQGNLFIADGNLTTHAAMREQMAERGGMGTLSQESNGFIVLRDGDLRYYSVHGDGAEQPVAGLLRPARSGSDGGGAQRVPAGTQGRIPHDAWIEVSRIPGDADATTRYQRSFGPLRARFHADVNPASEREMRIDFRRDDQRGWSATGKSSTGEAMRVFAALREIISDDIAQFPRDMVVLAAHSSEQADAYAAMVRRYTPEGWSAYRTAPSRIELVRHDSEAWPLYRKRRSIGGSADDPSRAPPNGRPQRPPRRPRLPE